MYRLLPPPSEAGGRGACTHDRDNVQGKPGSAPTGEADCGFPQFTATKGGGGGGRELETEFTSWTEEHEHKEEHETHGGGERETQ